MKVIIAGDYCDKDRVSDLIREGAYEIPFKAISPIIKSADYSIVNFEFPINNGNAKPILKNGPGLIGQKQSIEPLKYAGFNCCTLANNHIMDQGEECCLYTKQLIEANGMDAVGVGSNSDDARRVFYHKHNEETLAIINCCEHEFSVASAYKAGANGLDAISLYYSIREAKKLANYVLVIVHGGHEHFQLPSPRMKKLYRYIIDLGADAVVNHHQHCYSGFEYYMNKPIVYGLGNLLFDWEGMTIKTWSEGYLASILFSHESVKLDCIPYYQCKDNPEVRVMNGAEKKSFLEKIQRINEIIEDDDALQNAVNDYYMRGAFHYLFALEPYSGRVLRKLFSLKLLPSFLNKKKILSLVNSVECESHRDKFLYILKNSLIK